VHLSADTLDELTQRGLHTRLPIRCPTTACTNADKRRAYCLRLLYPFVCLKVASLLAAAKDDGPNRFIGHPTLRLLWRDHMNRAFEVPWPVFWAKFSARLRGGAYPEEKAKAMEEMLKEVGN
jgi:hypothetical protein